MRAWLALLLCQHAANAFITSSIHRKPVPAAVIHRHFSTVENKIISSKTDTAPAIKTDFDSFDYNSQWYPVIWAVDIPLNEPVRCTLFDVHYVVWKTLHGDPNDRKEVFYALLDSCPHKKVALSEGRITTGPCGTHQLQCSYHGWKFDGADGKCLEIPQTVIAQREHGTNTVTKSEVTSNKRRRQDATPIAVTEAQGMVWLHPSKSPLEALNIEGPPRIPELDLDGYKTTVAVRDFPIDWTVLMENIMDPDHGYFAHASSGSMALAFDWYASDGTENMIDIREYHSSTGWTITSSVNAVDKLIKYNKEVRMPQTGDVKNATPQGFLVNKPRKNEPPRIATTTFIAPSVISLGRRDNVTATSSFLTGFWICPVGTGKSRFMSAAISKSPIAIPRWLVHMNLNNFLDQDTYLLCGQNRAVLKSEAESYLLGDKSKLSNARKSTYVYKSPSERLGVRIGQFFDATLSRVPNRKASLLSWYNRNSNGNHLFEEWPSREIVLDRYGQHTAICPDSMDVVKNCDKVIHISKLVSAFMLLTKIMYDKTPWPMLQAVHESFILPTSIGSIKQMVVQLAAKVMALQVIQALMTNGAILRVLCIAALSHWFASRIKREFFFKFDRSLHNADIKHISKNWVDL